MIIFPCQVCHTQLSAQDAQANQLVRCPICSTTVRVPTQSQNQETADALQEMATAGASSGGYGSAPPMPPPGPQMQGGFQQLGGFQQMGGFRGTGRRYGFNCGYCSSRLEATESMAAQEGQCPTCGNRITIPILDRYGRLIDPKTRQIIKQDPHPVHAYAAAGERAPKIIRHQDGHQTIQCPRCSGVSTITSNNCKLCGMPFTMEGTTVEASGASNGFCVASLVLGIISVFAFCTGIAPMLALVFGIIGYNQVSARSAENAGKGMAVAGIVLGSLGIIGALLFYMRNFF